MAFHYEMSHTERAYIAGADLSAKQYFFVKMSAGKVIVPTADTDVPWGVVTNKPTADGQACDVVRRGIVKVVASAAIALGAPIGIASDGRVVTRVIGTDTTKYVIGTAEEAASGAGSLIAAFIDCVAPHRGA